MFKLRSEPFLWIHLSGIVLVPVLLQVVWVSLAMGESFSYILELSLLVTIGVLPGLIMQLTRPFDIFSILLLSLKPECLTKEQRSILSLFKTFKQKFFSIMAAIAMLFILWLLYRLSPLAVGLASFLPQWHILGLAIAAVAFWASNLFLQIPLSVLLVLLTKESKWHQVEPYPLEQIEQSFTVPGIKVGKILWFLESASDSLEGM